MKLINLVLVACLLARTATGAPDGGTSLAEDFADADAGIYTVDHGVLRDGGVVPGPAYLVTPERLIKVAAFTVDLQNRNARLLSENEQLQLELDRARNGRPLFGGTFWTGMAVGAVVTVIVIGGTAIWISSSHR